MKPVKALIDELFDDGKADEPLPSDFVDDEEEKEDGDDEDDEDDDDIEE